jgi:hypothetical protein
MVDIGVLEEETDYSSEWASFIPSFTIPKKNGTIRVVTHFRKFNLLLKKNDITHFLFQRLSNMT